MKNLFSAYYELNESSINEIWDNSLIVFDTNVLLSLYRCNEASRIEIIELLKSYKNRLWIPYQIALEFHRNREGEIQRTLKSYSMLSQTLESNIRDAFKKAIEPCAQMKFIDKNELGKLVDSCIQSITDNLTLQQEKHPDFASNDTVLEVITELYNGKVGFDYSIDKLKSIYLEGEERYSQMLPPGYKDANKRRSMGNRAVFGDLIIWKQTLDKSKEEKSDVIFVTDDNKTDWRDKEEGKHSPRKELIKEFTDYTNRRIIIYTSERFLKYAKTYKKANISQETINDVASETILQNNQIENNDFLNIDLLSHLEVIRKVPRFVDNDTFLDFDSVRKIKEITDSCKYTTNFEDVARSLYEPASLSNFRELSHKLKDFRETVDSMGGFREIQRKIQELSELTSFTRSKDSKENLVPTNSLEQATQ